MRVGILEILALPSLPAAETVYRLMITKQYASVTPQAVSVWCRQLGHETFYTTYYGIGDPLAGLPRDLDIIFISCYTYASSLAYALAKLFRRAGTRIVLGGPHAKAFPQDALRFFDLVVTQCDKSLVADILAGHFDPGSIIASAQPFADLPAVEERMPEIRATALLWGKQRIFMSTVPMLASMGCPYQCDFCVDWNNPYRLLPLERLKADLDYLARNYPGILLGFHDPNFAIKFDQVLEVLETLPPGLRLPYIMESSLSTLKGTRVKRLKLTNCVGVAPGIESWTSYSNKAGLGRKMGEEKVAEVAEHFQLLSENIPYLQGNMIFGLDTDKGNEPVRLTQEFMDRTPFVWPTLNIPTPFAGTPLYDQYLADDRILKTIPFGFYYAPYTAIIPKHYDPATYYEKLIELCLHSSSHRMLRRRMSSTSSWKVKMIHWARTASVRADSKSYRRILGMLRSDRKFRAFHEGQSDVLPEFYHREYERMLGPYAELLSRADRIPILAPLTPSKAIEQSPRALQQFPVGVELSGGV